MISVVDFKIAGDGGGADFVHAFFDRHMDGVGLVGDEGIHILEGGYKGDIVRSFAMEQIAARLQVGHAFDFAFHSIEVLHQRGDLFFILVLYFKQHDMSYHPISPFVYFYFPYFRSVSSTKIAAVATISLQGLFL